MDVNQAFLAHNIDLPPAALTFCAAASLTNAAAQDIPPGSTVNSLTIEQDLMRTAVLRLPFVSRVMSRTGCGQRPWPSPNGCSGGRHQQLGSRPRLKDDCTFTTPVTVAVGDVIQAVITPEVAGRVLTGVMVARLMFFFRAI
jgi:hypothetical protein